MTIANWLDQVLFQYFYTLLLPLQLNSSGRAIICAPLGGCLKNKLFSSMEIFTFIFSDVHLNNACYYIFRFTHGCYRSPIEYYEFLNNTGYFIPCCGMINEILISNIYY